jgi:hypothetical protein
VGGVGLGGDGPVQETGDGTLDAIFGVANMCGARHTGRRPAVGGSGEEGTASGVGWGGSWWTRAAWWAER